MKVGAAMISFRKAKMSDVENLHQLITEFANKELMLPRSRNTLYEALREFTIIEDQGQLVGAAALHIIWDNLAEIRALAIKEEYQRQGVGQQLIARLLKEAGEMEIHQVFALTYQVEFFKKSGFSEVSKDDLSQKVWKECINCPKFPNCDEVAMTYHL
jgi:amino-acid N-acetyltransferase